MRRPWILHSSHSRQRRTGVSQAQCDTSQALISLAASLIVLMTASFAPQAAAEDGIYVMKIDGSDERKVVSVDGIQHHTSPRWSHDGRRLAFVTIDDDGMERSHVVNLDGTERKELGEMASPDWSPDDKQVVFHYDGDNMQQGVWVQNVGGDGLNWLVDGAYPALVAGWRQDRILRRRRPEGSRLGR